ncbi:MAG: rod-binding protein [Planctomycetes bacterium]|nr:rod-binding protein [Planctomycetota bacterium]
MSEVDMASRLILPGGDPAAGAAALQRAARAGAGTEEAAKAAKDFEAILIHRLMEEMRRTIPQSGLLDSGTTDQMEGLFWFHLAQEVADKGGLGLWRELARDIAPAGRPPAEATAPDTPPATEANP